MIAVGIVLAMLAWGVWWLYRGAGVEKIASATERVVRPGGTQAREPKAHPDVVSPFGSWSALDELQLTRMLAESASVDPPASDPSSLGASAARDDDH